MTSHLLIVEKPNLAMELHRHLKLPNGTVIVSTHPLGIWQRPMPKLSFPDIPFTAADPSLSPNFNGAGNLISIVDCDKIRDLTPDLIKHGHSNQFEALLEVLNDYHFDEVTAYVDFERRSIWQVHKLVSYLSRVSYDQVRMIQASHLSGDVIRQAWGMRKFAPSLDSPQFKDIALAQEAKRLFDYWWAANSKMIYSELCRKCDLEAGHIVSKYELMMLVMLYEYGQCDLCELVAGMIEWRGTGKFEKTHSTSIGTIRSRHPILENAIKRGAVTANDRYSKIQLSDEGTQFVKQLHPKSFDPDLPFRLDQWITEKNTEAMGRYIRTHFGRQLRFQRNHHSEN